jgi:hypothetical protein
MYPIRDQNVILDSDVAELYGIETMRVNEAVKITPNIFTEKGLHLLDTILKSPKATQTTIALPLMSPKSRSTIQHKTPAFDRRREVG